jgi:hypothetical protein
MGFVWGFKCMFCLEIYYSRLKVVFCVMDATLAIKLCSMFSIHLYYGNQNLFAIQQQCNVEI